MLTPERFSDRFPECPPPSLPRIGAFSIAVEDLDLTGTWLTAHDVPYRRSDVGIWVRAEHANGCITEFITGNT